ncbi:Coiled-coil domain-containing protein 40 (Protein links) [Durusdinium trenchii]|uniref:Coiled-coil domain-containing protein 40 (Protein links) n=1 Tax=Durusdinium trenchii TaxID=1381693 RepID=A0ABP0KQD6_9DINO
MEKDQMNQDILESERQVLLWERKITLEREMQAALDPNVGQADAAAMKKEIHRMELRLEQLKRRQEQMIVEMERAIHKRDTIALKLEPKAKKTKQATNTANVKRQLQSLRNNLKLCTQANAEAEQKISERQQDLQELQQTIEAAVQD